MGIHEAKHELVVLGTDEGRTLGEAVSKPSPWMPGHKGQSVWPIRVGPELAMAVDGLVELVGESWERDRARLEGLEARGRGRLPRASWPDRPSRHAVLLELLRLGLRERTRARGKRSPARVLPRAGAKGVAS